MYTCVCVRGVCMCIRKMNVLSECVDMRENILFFLFTKSFFFIGAVLMAVVD